MTLLNTLSNLGGTWPKYFILTSVETFGYYEVGTMCVILGTFIFFYFIKPQVQMLQGLREKSWRLDKEKIDGSEVDENDHDDEWVLLMGYDFNFYRSEEQDYMQKERRSGNQSAREEADDSYALLERISIEK